jgi:class 3 adenylate cyclase
MDPMSATPVKRRLAAILAADAVGYSRMMGIDEEGTLRILAAHRAVIDGIIAFHHGRIINTAGDSVLAEFESAVEAVRCAVEIQDALKTRNDALLEAQRMLFRIGVNLGDVMVSGDNLHGDGVNVAARLESAAEPGGVFIASSVYDQIAGKLNLTFVDIGSRELKNIARPIHVYKLSGTAPAKVATAIARPGARRFAKPAWAMAGILALVLAALAAMQMDPGILAPRQESIEAQLAKARAEAAEAKRQLELQKRAQAKSKPAVRSAAKPVEPKPSTQVAPITAEPPARPAPAQPAPPIPQEVAVSAAEAPAPVAPVSSLQEKKADSGSFLPGWLWSSGSQKAPATR